MTALGHPQEALPRIRRALELDPLSAIINRELAHNLFVARRYEEAIEQCKRTLEMDSDFSPANNTLGRAYVQKGMYKEGIAALQKVVNPDGRPSTYLVYAYARLGQRAQAERVIRQWNYQPIGICAGFGALKEYEQAFQCLERAFEEHNAGLIWIKVHPEFDPLRPDARFTTLLKKMRMTN